MTIPYRNLLVITLHYNIHSCMYTYIRISIFRGKLIHFNCKLFVIVWWEFEKYLLLAYDDKSVRNITLSVTQCRI